MLPGARRGRAPRRRSPRLSDRDALRARRRRPLCDRRRAAAAAGRAESPRGPSRSWSRAVRRWRGWGSISRPCPAGWQRPSGPVRSPWCSTVPSPLPRAWRGQDGAVGFRCSTHPVAAALARRVAREGIGPLTATSLNRSGEPPARTRAQAARCCDGRPGSPILMDAPGAEAGGGTPSSVLDVTGPSRRCFAKERSRPRKSPPFSRRIALE